MVGALWEPTGSPGTGWNSLVISPSQDSFTCEARYKGGGKVMAGGVKVGGGKFW